MRLIDSDVIIWNWRSQEAAAALLAAEPFAISAVTYMELVQGMRNVRELKNLQADLALWQVTILSITKAISERAVRLVEEHFLAHHLFRGPGSKRQKNVKRRDSDVDMGTSF